jgi:hypothetical protein
MKRVTIVLQGCALVTVLFLAAALAGRANLKTRITFSGSVRVPGLVLPAGTYYFEAPNFNNRTTVRITKEDGSLVTQVAGVADYRHEANHEVIIFGDHECGPQAIKAWFYPGNKTGVRFVYPKEEAEVIAASCNEPVPETHEKYSETGQVENKVYIMTPQKQEQDYSPEALSGSDQADQNGFDAATGTTTPHQPPSPPQ